MKDTAFSPLKPHEFQDRNSFTRQTDRKERNKNSCLWMFRLLVCEDTPESQWKWNEKIQSCWCQKNLARIGASSKISPSRVL